MGGCVSIPDRTAKDDADGIGRRFGEGNSRRSRRECKILLLGSEESGKSTIVKQMRLILEGEFGDLELEEWKPVVFKDVLDSAQQVVSYMQKMGLGEGSTRVLVEKIIDYRLDSQSTLTESRFSPEVAEAIYQLWEDASVQKLVNGYRSDLCVMDSAEYFFNQVRRIGQPEYVPSTVDVLRARRKTVGITETRFTIGQLPIRMVEIGPQRVDRKTWIQCCESVTSVIFCAGMSEYDQASLKDKTKNRMAESMAMFESVVNSRWFRRTSIILFLNKIDVFKDKLSKVPLERYFPEYTGGSNINKAAKYILWRYMQLNRAQLSVYPHLTQVVDFPCVSIRLVLDVLQETIIEDALRNPGIL